MREYPGIGKRGFLAALRDDVRKVADAISIPQGAAEMVKSGFAAGIRMGACLVAAHELQKHAKNIFGQAVGELVIREADEDQAVQSQAFERGRAYGDRQHFESGRLLGHVEGCAWRREAVPRELQEQIRKLQAANGWRGPVMVFEDQDDEPGTAGVDTPWKTVQQVDLVDEQQPEPEDDGEETRSFTFAMPGPRAAAGDAG